MTERVEITAACEYAATIGYGFGTDALPAVANVAFLSEGAMPEEKVTDLTKRTFCDADGCSLTLGLIQEWAVAGTLGAPEADELANRIRTKAARDCLVRWLVDQHPPQQPESLL